MAGIGGTKRTLAAASVTLLMAFTVLSALAGGASAAATPASGSPSGSSVDWAYGGQASSNGYETINSLTVAWNVSFGLVVIFNATSTGANTVELQAERTVMLNLQLSATNGSESASFGLQALEVDHAYANLTNASTVYVGTTPVPALGVINASVSARASLAEAVNLAFGPEHESVSLNAAAHANASVAFAPSLGIIPLNLTGISAWNSSAVATPSAAWNISYSYAAQSFNGTSISGGNSTNGSWMTSGLVSLAGHVFTTGIPSWHDHHARTGVVLVLAGPADLYDGFIFIPRGFDLFGGSGSSYNASTLGNVTISSESVFVTGGHLGADSFSAAEAYYGTTTSTAAIPGAHGVAGSAGTVGPGTSVVAQPESPSQASSQASCMQDPASCVGASPWFSGLVAVAVITLAVVAIAGTVLGFEWRSYARRKSRNELAGGNGPQMTNGIPPGAAAPPAPPASVTGNPPSDPTQLNRQL